MCGSKIERYCTSAKQQDRKTGFVCRNGINTTERLLLFVVVSSQRQSHLKYIFDFFHFYFAGHIAPGHIIETLIQASFFIHKNHNYSIHNKQQQHTQATQSWTCNWRRRHWHQEQSTAAPKPIGIFVVALIIIIIISSNNRLLVLAGNVATVMRSRRLLLHGGSAAIAVPSGDKNAAGTAPAANQP